MAVTAKKLGQGILNLPLNIIEETTYRTAGGSPQFLLTDSTFLDITSVGARIGTIQSDGSVSFGNLFSYSFGTLAYGKKISDGTFLISFSDSSNSNYPTCVVLTVSGSTISVGSKYVISTIPQTSYNTEFEVIDSTKVVFAYLSSATTVSCVVGTISGTVVTLGTVANGTNTNLTKGVNVSKFNNSYILVTSLSYNSGTNTNLLLGFLFSISSNTLTFVNTTTIINWTGGGSQRFIEYNTSNYLSQNNIFVGISASFASTIYQYFFFINLNGTTVTVTSNNPRSNPNNIYYSVKSIYLDDSSTLLLSSGDSSNTNLFLIKRYSSGLHYFEGTFLSLLNLSTSPLTIMKKSDGSFIFSSVSSNKNYFSYRDVNFSNASLSVSFPLNNFVISPTVGTTEVSSIHIVTSSSLTNLGSNSRIAIGINGLKQENLVKRVLVNESSDLTINLSNCPIILKNGDSLCFLNEGTIPFTVSAFGIEEV